MASAGLELRRAAREIFDAALRGVDARRALRRAVKLDGPRLLVNETIIELSKSSAGIYVIALGKAAWRMALALDEILGEHINAGLIIGPRISQRDESAGLSAREKSSISQRWRSIEGGHPLPDKTSLLAAREAFALLSRANNEAALVFFLISGGGSAMIEWPRDHLVTLKELRAATRSLISCGASIAEINSVRRSFSAVKGGGLAERAPEAAQISLIISDTGRNEEASVASGPTFSSTLHAPPTPLDVVARYGLAKSLPASILRLIRQATDVSSPVSSQGRKLRLHYLLLDNDNALKAAAKAARHRGFVVKIARDIIEQPVEEGSRELISRILTLRERARDAGQPVCLISGGEFSCPVRGDGRGGRNSETALRWAIEMEKRGLASGKLLKSRTQLVALSAGTDGIDGNSPAAGALADRNTIARARALGLDAHSFLERSDAYNFFAALGDTIMTGPTGTNVRDLRLLLLL